MILNASFSSGRKQEARARHESAAVSSVHPRDQRQAAVRLHQQHRQARRRSQPMHETARNSRPRNRGTAGRSSAPSASASSRTPPSPSSPPSASPSRSDAFRDAGSRAADSRRRWLRASPSGATTRTTEPEKWRASAASAFDRTRIALAWQDRCRFSLACSRTAGFIAGLSSSSVSF